MKKDRAYFNDNVMYAVEVEYDGGGRQWERSVGYNLKDTLDDIESREGESLSDIDCCTHQPDDWCKRVLNVAHLNFTRNWEWCKSRGMKSLDDVVEYVIAKELA